MHIIALNLALLIPTSFEEMADTARDKADTKEFWDSDDVLQNKIKKLAELIKKSEYCCAFTGAGISTACGIADFRSGINTKLDVGAGMNIYYVIN